MNLVNAIDKMVNGPKVMVAIKCQSIEDVKILTMAFRKAIGFRNGYYIVVIAGHTDSEKHIVELYCKSRQLNLLYSELKHHDKTIQPAKNMGRIDGILIDFEFGSK